MKTYLVPVIDAQGRQTLLRVRATSLSDARIRATALIPSGSTLGASPTEVVDVEGNIDTAGLQSFKQNFPNLATNINTLSNINNVSAFPSGGVSELFDGEDPGGTFGGFRDPSAFDTETTGTGLQQEQELFPFGSFLQAARGRGLDPEGQFGTTVRDQFDPLAASFELAGVVPGISPTSTFQEFAARGIGRGGQVASETLRDLFAGNLGSAGTAATRAGQFLAPDVRTVGGRTDLATVRQLARSAGAEQFSPFVARNLLPSVGRVGRELQQLQAGGGFGQGGQPTFRDFFRQQFGLRF